MRSGSNYLRWMFLVTLLAVGRPGTAAGDGATTASLVVNATFASRTSLKVSTDLLAFDVIGSGLATAAVDFTAAARTRHDGEVILSVTALRALEAPATDGRQPAVALSGADANDAVTAGGDHPEMIAGRWIGSGLRTGRLVFTLRGGPPRRYVVPVQFVLSAP